MKISAIIITKNEENKIEKSIASLSFCDEVVVVDDVSTDDTAKRAEKAGAKVFIHSKNHSFADQRNWAMTQTKNEWNLFVDADEEVSEELENEIRSNFETFKRSNVQMPVVAYAIPRRDYFWNTELKYGETRKARTNGLIRLMKKGEGVWIGSVHETFVATGSVGKFKGFLNHHSHESLSSFVQDINVYSSLRATELLQKGHKSSLFELFFLPFGKFINTYFILGGFMDGPAGFVYSFAMSFHSFLVRAKLFTKSYV